MLRMWTCNNSGKRKSTKNDKNKSQLSNKKPRIGIKPIRGNFYIYSEMKAHTASL